MFAGSFLSGWRLMLLHNNRKLTSNGLRGFGCPQSSHEFCQKADSVDWKWHYRNRLRGKSGAPLIFMRWSSSNPTDAQKKNAPATESGAKDKVVADPAAIRAEVRRERKRRAPIDYSQEYTDNNYIPAVRAMNDYLLKPKDLEAVRKSTKRSPVTDSPPMVVYLRKDIEQRAVEVWGSLEALQREKKKRREVDVEYNLQVSNVKRVLRDIARGRSGDSKQDDRDAFQIILAVGLMGSARKPDKLHPYGYSSLRYVSSLVSGLGIFFFGFGLSVYHGIIGLLHPTPIASLYWAFFVLGGSLLSEGGTLLVALGQIRKHARLQGISIWNYVLRGQDPNVNVVLLEDMAAVVGVGIAATSMGLATYYNSHLPDVIGSLCIGGLLGAVASFIIYTNTVALVGRSISMDLQNQLTKVLESDVLVRSVYDVKAIDLGGMNIRYKAEIDFDGRQLTRSYLDKQDLERMMEEVQSLKTVEELEGFMTKHGENIVDLLGSEVDRIEANLKKKYPEVRHVDLEVL